jgi:hypothetical protein
VEDLPDKTTEPVGDCADGLRVRVAMTAMMIERFELIRSVFSVENTSLLAITPLLIGPRVAS